MEILVTGGAGFIGSHAADRLLRDGHHVTILDNLRHGALANVPKGADFLEMDLRDSRLSARIGALCPEVILHYAAQIDVRISCADPVYDAEENIIGTLKLIEAGLASGLRQFVFASSGGAIYGEAAGPQREGHPARPVTPYGAAKLAVDTYLATYAQQRGLRTCSLRFSNVYGPRQGAKGEAGVVAVFARALCKGQAPRINGDGLQTRDFVYVEDLAEAASRVVAGAYAGILNLGTGTETAILDLARLLCEEAGLAPDAVQHGPEIPGEQRRSVLDATLAGRDIGWKPNTDLATGLAKTLQWFRNACA